MGVIQMSRIGVANPAKVDFDGNAVDYISANGLQAEFQSSLDRVHTHFPSATHVSVAVAQDPEDTEACLMMLIRASMKPDEFQIATDEFMAPLRELRSKLYFSLAVLPE
jgi:hypothetical protein